jgi:hypothetical protein
MRVEQGVYENGVFKLLRKQNGDAIDYGLRFGEEPTVLRVTYWSGRESFYSLSRPQSQQPGQHRQDEDE